MRPNRLSAPVLAALIASAAVVSQLPAIAAQTPGRPHGSASSQETVARFIEYFVRQSAAAPRSRFNPSGS